jgi:hypothetical protein
LLILGRSLPKAELSVCPDATLSARSGHAMPFTDDHRDVRRRAAFLAAPSADLHKAKAAGRRDTKTHHMAKHVLVPRTSFLTPCLLPQF